MRRLFLGFLSVWLAALPCGAVEPVAAFPRPVWFRQHFAGPRTHIELQAPRRLSEFVLDGKLELSLKAYLELVLANNTDIALARLQVEPPANAIQRAFADYDPVAQASFSDTRVTQSSISALEGVATVKSDSQPLSLSYSQFLPTGTSLSVNFDGRRDNTNAVYATYNPTVGSQLTFSMEHPLLRNRGGSLTKLNILMARSSLKISGFQLRDMVTALIAQAENIYWDAIEARENVSVASKFVELRAAALDRQQKLVDSGAALPLDIYQPKSDYAAAQLQVIQAKRALAQRENALRMQIGADLDPAVRELPIVLTEPLTIPVLPPPDKEQAVQKAMQARPDRQAIATSLDTDDLSIRRATEALRPNLSVTAGYRSQGVGGTYLETGVAGGLGDALSQMFHFGFPVYSYGLRLRFPVRDHAAAADLADALVRKKADALQLRKVEQNMRLQVLNAVDNLNAARASLDQAQQAREFAGKRFDAEQTKYELGINQIFFVLTAQTDLNVAENLVLNQSLNYRRNLIGLYQVTGQLLDERGIVVE
ncbi:MAG: TolC family protein [Acidobacteriia bacterium]|nr:TolC family protein [Terriglobia bacterium]